MVFGASPAATPSTMKACASRRRAVVGSTPRSLTKSSQAVTLDEAVIAMSTEVRTESQSQASTTKGLRRPIGVERTRSSARALAAGFLMAWSRGAWMGSGDIRSDLGGGTPIHAGGAG